MLVLRTKQIKRNLIRWCLWTYILLLKVKHYGENRFMDTRYPSACRVFYHQTIMLYRVACFKMSSKGIEKLHISLCHQRSLVLFEVRVIGSFSSLEILLMMLAPLLADIERASSSSLIIWSRLRRTVSSCLQFIRWCLLRCNACS